MPFFTKVQQELKDVQNVPYARVILKGETAMPTLIWIAFWSSLVGTAMCLQQAALPVRIKTPKVKNDDRSRS
jgi:hypothetical protein